MTIVVVLVVSTGTLLLTPPIHASSPYAPHAAILIIGNSQFTPNNGVRGGSGTRSDPFLISDWSIVAANGQAAILIESTTAYFLIRHVQFLNAQPGVYLTGVANGAIENSTLMNSQFGIRIESSLNIIISGNNISGPYDGVYVADILSAPQTTGLTITNNTFSGAGAVVDSNQSHPSNLNITGNTFLSTGLSTSAYGAIVARNNMTWTSTSFGPALIVEGNSSLVNDNSILGADIQVSGDGTIVRNNRASKIFLYRTATTLSDNVLTGGVLLAAYSPFDTLPFYDSHIMTGNAVNGKPLVYLARCSGASVDGASFGEVIVANCTGVRVANLRLSGTVDGIVMAYVHQCSIVGNSLSGYISDGVVISKSSDLEVSGNDFNGSRLRVSDTDNLKVIDNLGDPFISILRGSAISVSNNTLKGVGAALRLTDVINANITGNWVSDGGGITVSGANGLNITGNDLVRNDVGLTLDLGSLNGIFNSLIYHNNFVDNTRHQAAYRPQVAARFDNGFPTGGNYWSDYRAVDNCSGSQQNICSGPDGIGDTPYSGIWELGFETRGVPGAVLDHYPLVNPSGNFSWDIAAPSWPAGGGLKVSTLNSTTVTLQWTGAVDDAWVSGYRVYQDSTLLASLPRYVQNYTVTHLTPGSTHLFKIQAGDPARNWSTYGPSATVTLPEAGNSPSPSTTQAHFTMSWWMVHWYLGVLTGGLVGLTVAGIVFIRRKRA